MSQIIGAVKVEITRGSETEEIDITHNSLKISNSNTANGQTCSFKTEEEIKEWDIITITEFDKEIIHSVNPVNILTESLDFLTTEAGEELKTEYTPQIIEEINKNIVFAGIVEKVEIHNKKGVKIYTAKCSTWKRLFDRTKIAYTYETETAGDIIKDIITNWTTGFTIGDIEDGADIKIYPINNEAPSDAIEKLANTINYNWRINTNKSIDFFSRTTETAPLNIDGQGEFYEELKITPNVSEITNVVILRGGQEKTIEQTHTEKGDGLKTIFYLPHSPTDITVKVNGTIKTVGIEFIEETPTTDFVVNYNSKYIKNGVETTLTSSDTLTVDYKYYYDIRIKVKRQNSIDAMKLLFPTTNGEFEKVLEDTSISSKETAKQYAETYLDNYSNTTISGSFYTEEEGLEVGQLLNIYLPEFTGSAVIQKITKKLIAGRLWKNTIQFSTVLFGFEEFLKNLLFKQKISIDENETVEVFENYSENLTFSELVNAETDENSISEEIELADENYSELNKSISYVLTPYFPTGFTDNKRAFLLDYSKLS